MTDHLSTLQVKQLSVSALPEGELAAAAIHTAECQSCNQRFVEELKRQRGPAPFNFSLEPEFWFRNDHLDFDDLVGLADNTFDEETLEIVNIHLNTCASCREDVRSFLVFRDATALEMDISYGPTENQGAHHNIEAAAWWRRFQTRPVYAVAAIVLVAVAVLIGVVALGRRWGPLEAVKQDQTNSGVERGSNISPSPAPSVTSSPESVDDSVKIATLKDGAGEVTIDKNGRVTGLDELSENSRQYVAQAVVSERIEPADVLRRLSGEQSGLRGDDNAGRAFRLLYPVQTVVIDEHPIFRWKSLPNAASYQVFVLDANGKQVSQSEALPPNQTKWKAPVRLRRGHVFSWVVTALMDGKKVVSPSASAPEVKFAVLPTTDFQELVRLKRSNSHLALGVFYARVGLRDEAERELQSLIELNSQSELPRKLLESVRHRKAN